jgi:hypothetical protein
LTAFVIVKYLDGMNPSPEFARFEETWQAFSTQKEWDLHALLDDVEERDPRGALAAIGLLRRYLDEAEDEAVLRGRVEGMSWFEIAAKLGRTKQAVWQQHRDPQDTDANE